MQTDPTVIFKEEFISKYDEMIWNYKPSTTRETANRCFWDTLRRRLQWADQRARGKGVIRPSHGCPCLASVDTL